MEASAFRWWAWGIGDHDGGFGRARWSQGFNDYNGGVNWGSRRYNASEWTSPTAEAPVRLWDQGIDDSNGSVSVDISRVRRVRRLSNDGGGVGRRRVIYDASEGSETTTEAVVTRQRAWEIYDNGGGVGGGRWARILLLQQRRRRRRIYNVSKGSETITEAAAYQRQARWIGKDNGVLIFLAIGLLTVTLSCLCLFAVSFWYCFHQILFFFAARNTISTANMLIIFLYQVFANLEYVPPMYRTVKKLQVCMINKAVRKSLACKKGNYILIWSWKNSVTVSWLYNIFQCGLQKGV